MSVSEKRITLLSNIDFVVNQGKPLVDSFLEVQNTDVPRGELEHYAAALQSILNTEKYASPNREHTALIEAVEKKYPQLVGSFRAWYYDMYIRH